MPCFDLPHGIPSISHATWPSFLFPQNGYPRQFSPSVPSERWGVMVRSSSPEMKASPLAAGFMQQLRLPSYCSEHVPIIFVPCPRLGALRCYASPAFTSQTPSEERLLLPLVQYVELWWQIFQVFDFRAQATVAVVGTHGKLRLPWISPRLHAMSSDWDESVQDQLKWQFVEDYNHAALWQPPIPRLYLDLTSLDERARTKAACEFWQVQSRRRADMSSETSL